jgi:hypothetical protein
MLAAAKALRRQRIFNLAKDLCGWHNQYYIGQHRLRGWCRLFFQLKERPLRTN